MSKNKLDFASVYKQKSQPKLDSGPLLVKKLSNSSGQTWLCMYRYCKDCVSTGYGKTAQLAQASAFANARVKFEETSSA